MRLLLVEDTALLAEQIAKALDAEQFVVDVCASAVDAQHLGQEIDYDAVILDLGLPDGDGLDVLRSWRSKGRTFPVLILTARDAWYEKVQGIDAGADDYLAKPFHMPELLARCRALIRRSVQQPSPILEVGDWVLDTLQHQIYFAKNLLTLTNYEYRLLSYLLYRPNTVVSQTTLMEHLYGEEFDPDSNTIEVFIARIRKKTAAYTIRTVRGQGYCLVALPSSET